MKACVQGTNRNGLRYFFNNTVSKDVFPGFTFKNTITQKTGKDEFFRSLESQFERYYSNADGVFATDPNPRACDDALRGQALLVMAASAMNGYYFMDLLDYIEKGR